MEKLSSDLHFDSSPEETSFEVASLTNEHVADVKTELVAINRTVTELRVEQLICSEKMDENLKRRQDIVHDICLLISILEKSLIFYEEMENTRRNLEEILSCGRSDSDDGDCEDDDERERRKIIDEITDIQSTVSRARKQVETIKTICVLIEPHFRQQSLENEKIHAKLWDKLKKIKRARQEAIARHDQLLTTIRALKRRI